jgi:beta-galactosidase/beta-glucuronidase
MKIYKKILFAISILHLSSAFSFSQKIDWKIAGSKIVTEWAAQVNPANPLPQYPRPQMVRNNWKNLNGLWNYSIRPKDEVATTSSDGKILVPFAVESALSGVAKTVGKDSVLWYKTSFAVPSSMKGQKVLLHFGAVDWQAEVYVNDKKMGEHKGGYDPFTVDITQALKKGDQQLQVRVWDPTDDGPQPRGKQVKRPSGIWYTPVTGIWQTVWLEAVPQTYILSTKQVPDIDKQTLTVSTNVENWQQGDMVRVSAWDGANKVDEKTVNGAVEANLLISNAKLWSPESPFLYDLKVAIVRNGKVMDEVKSYFAMRKISLKPDANGVQRMMLNNKFVFEFGPLDQGWWPDGLYTAPTDEALKFDIVKTKEMGFNMIRKHVKVEPARWYNYCDKLGMLVWQDMPSGDLGNRWDARPGIVGRATEKDRTAESEHIYRTEWGEIMDDLYNFPSIVAWVPFNEAWGQFKTVEITNWTMQHDPSRLVNSASGGNFYQVGHIVDLHNYPEPAMPLPNIFGSKQAVVLGEFGGLGLPLEGHTWQERNNWGYRTFTGVDTLFNTYSSFVRSMVPFIKQGLSAAVYTQTTDVEIETNGLMTYDRKVMKMPVEKLKAVNQQLYNPAIANVVKQ